MSHSHVAILGGGIVGLATAYNLTRQQAGLSVRILEKEPEVGAHQTGHNSGVLHSGIYYKPGSLKAANCRIGKQAMERFCLENGVPHDICGKVIVAVDEREFPALQKIYERGQQNDVRCEIIGHERLKELEPYAAGVKAIHVPEAGIVNYRAVCRKMAELVRKSDGDVRTGARVIGIRHEERLIAIQTTAGDFTADYVVNCTGLFADRVAKLTGRTTPEKVIPFRGEYFELRPESQYLCKNLIYPVPDASFPFLGVHFTRMIEGGIECGPNAVLAFAREGYKKTDINFRDLAETLTYGGFLKLAARHWRMGAGEMWRSLSKRAFVRALSRLMPLIQDADFIPHRAGIRAQAISPAGNLIDDFLIDAQHRVVNVLNAPSPAATSSLNVGKLVCEQLTRIMS
ncbi:MAG: L-2-hydroxyglutarate oxidase [Pirellulaceae bacterium]